MKNVNKTKTPIIIFYICTRVTFIKCIYFTVTDINFCPTAYTVFSLRSLIPFWHFGKSSHYENMPIQIY